MDVLVEHILHAEQREQAEVRGHGRRHAAKVLHVLRRARQQHGLQQRRAGQIQVHLDVEQPDARVELRPAQLICVTPCRTAAPLVEHHQRAGAGGLLAARRRTDLVHRQSARARVALLLRQRPSCKANQHGQWCMHRTADKKVHRRAEPNEKRRRHNVPEVVEGQAEVEDALACQCEHGADEHQQHAQPVQPVLERLAVHVAHISARVSGGTKPRAAHPLATGPGTVTDSSATAP